MLFAKDRRFLTFIVATSFYGVVSCLFLAGRFQHFQLVLLAILYILVLPATVLALSSPALTDKSPVALPPLVLLLAAYLVPALLMSWVSNQGILFADELAYEFQARTFALGSMQAEAPPGAPVHSVDTPVALRFEHYVLDHGRWFGKYPWGWPWLLSLGLRVHTVWEVNPVLGLAILLLTFGIARRLYGWRTGVLAVWMGVLSPFFLANCIGRMSHPACGLLLAGACLCCFEGLRTGKLWLFVAMFLLTGVACEVRPLTAAAVGTVLGLAVLWDLRRDRRLGVVLLIGAAIGVLAAASMFLWNRIYTGDYLVSPYALADPSGPPELDFHLGQVFHNLTHQTRWAVQATVFFTFPFVFLAAAYAVWRDREHRRAAVVLGLLFPTLVLVHLVEPEVAIEFSGERYYFEAFFAVLILGARGITLLIGEWRTARPKFIGAASLFTAVALAQQAFAANIILAESRPSRELHAAAEQYEGTHTLVFWQDSAPFFSAKHFNLNEPDWQHQDLFYLVDPGPEERDSWACRMGRPHWVTLRYEPATRSIAKQEGTAKCAAR